MTSRPLPEFEVDLVIENDGHQAAVKGSGHDFVARFQSLSDLFHFGRTFWPVRKSVPHEIGIVVAWRWLRFRAKSAR